MPNRILDIARVRPDGGRAELIFAGSCAPRSTPCMARFPLSDAT